MKTERYKMHPIYFFEINVYCPKPISSSHQIKALKPPQSTKWCYYQHHTTRHRHTLLTNLTPNKSQNYEVFEFH